MRRSPLNIVSILVSVFVITGLISSSAQAQSTPSFTIHDILSEPQTDQFAYDVSVLFSLYDSSGDPVRDLAISDLSVTEDGKRVDPTGLTTADQDPINITLVIDTSGSMSGVKMDAAKQAASRFISSLGSNDKAAFISFNSQVKTEIDFTDNLPAVQEKVELLTAVNGSGTCFFDALYKAVELSASIPSGRRAIVILTDGRDELPNGGKCSKYTDQDVIDLATKITTRVPIYTLGLGNKVDASGLERLAARTGGLYQFASDPEKLEDVFTKLSDQLRSQYLLKYVSIAPPGPHVLVLKADTNSIHEQNSRDFLLPPFPYRIVFTAPTEGANVNGETLLIAQLLGQGEPIARVEFFENGTSLGAVENPPYELKWTPSTNASQIKLEAAAYGEAGGELARTSVTVTASTTLAETTPEATVATKTPLKSTSAIAIGGVGAVILLIVVVVLVTSIKKKQREQKRDAEWREKVQSDVLPSTNFGDERTLDSFTPSEGALGMLVVLQSDDSAMVGQRIEISKAVTTLGRKADNDVIFAKDSPVSRHHAVIEERNGSLFLSEVIAMDDGSPKRPAYGTFVNGKQIEDPVLLHDGDEFRLGKRVSLRFESLNHVSSDDERTMDQFNSGDEKTMDFGS